MTIRNILLLILFGSSFQLFAELPPKQRTLIVKGKVVDENDDPIPFVEVETIFIQESYFSAIPATSKSKTDSLGQYQITIKDFGNYKISFNSKGKMTYSLSAKFTKNESLLINLNEYILPLDITLLPKAKKSKLDIYNGADLFFELRKVTAVPYTRYIQLTDYKMKKGFKSSKKLAKYTYKQVKKGKVKKLVLRIADRPEIDSVIYSKNYTPETKQKWYRNYAKKSSDIFYDKNRIELTQISFDKMIQKNSEDEFIHEFKNYKLDLNKTVKTDDSKKVFNIYQFSFITGADTPVVFDAILINTSNGWKIFTIYQAI